MKMDNALSSETLNSVPKKNKRKKKNRKTLVPTEDEVTPLETEANVNAKLVPRKEEAAQLEIEPDVDTKLVTKEETAEFETEADVNTKLEPTSKKKKRGKRKRHRRDDGTKMDSTDHESVSMKSSVSEGDLHPESVVGINGEMNLERCPSESVVNNESAASGELGPTPRKKKRKKRSKSNSTEINNIEHENLNGVTVESTVKESEEQFQDGSDQTGVERTQNLESSTPNEDLSCSKVKEKKKKKGEKRKNKKNWESDDKVSESLEGTDMENVVLDKIESVQPSGKASARTESEAEQMDHALQQNVGMLSQAVTHAKHLAKDCGNFVTEVAGLNSTDTKEKSPVTDEHNGFPIGVDSGSIKKRDDYIDALESKEIETYKRKKRSKSNSTEINNIEHENLNGATVESTVKESEEQLQDGSDQTGVERKNLESSTPNEDLSCSKVKEKKKKKRAKRKNKKNRESDDKVSESLEGNDMENVVLDKIESVQPSGKASARTESEAEQMDHALQQNVGTLIQAVTHAKHLAKDCGNFFTEVAGLNSTDTKEKSPVTDEHNGFPIGVDSGSIKKRDDYIDALESKEIETYKRKRRNRHKKKRKSSELEDTTQSVEDNDVNNTSSHCLVEADTSGLPENIETRMDEKESDSVNHSDINPASQVRKKVKTMSSSGGTTCRNKYLNDASELDVSEEGNEQKNRGVLAKEHDALKLDAIEIELTREEAPSLHSVKVKDGVHLDSTTKEANLLQIPETLPERTLVARSRRKLLILDVNGLLVDFVSYPSRQFRHDITISKKYVYKRPYCDEFLEFCFDKFNVGVWSSRMKSNMEKVIDFLFKDSKQKLLFCWDQSHCTATGFNTLENRSKPLVFKELRKLWEKLEPDLPFERGYYDETNTLLLDDTPYKALRNPANTAIFPKSYQHCDRRDNSLGPGGDLRTYLEGLAMTDDVRKYVENNPFGQEAITKSHKSWEFYSKLL